MEDEPVDAEMAQEIADEILKDEPAPIQTLGTAYVPPAPEMWHPGIGTFAVIYILLCLPFFRYFWKHENDHDAILAMKSDIISALKNANKAMTPKRKRFW